MEHNNITKTLNTLEIILSYKGNTEPNKNLKISLEKMRTVL